MVETLGQGQCAAFEIPESIIVAYMSVLLPTEQALVWQILSS